MELFILILLVFAALVWLTPMLLKIFLRRIVKRYMGIDLDNQYRNGNTKAKTESKRTSHSDDLDERPHPTDGHKIFGDDEGEYINYTDVRES